MNPNTHFVMEGPLALEIMSYLLSRPMGEVESLVLKLRQLREANIVAEPPAEPVQS